METSYIGLKASALPSSAREGVAFLKLQRPLVIWLTGMSGAGKSTLADMLDKELRARDLRTFILDGDRLRSGLNRDLDFSDASRHESIRRTSEVARLMVDAGVTVIVSLISPFRADRDAARALFEAAQFFEVHVDAPLAVVEARDVKGLYKKAREGLIPQFTGIDSPYEPPLNPELRLNTAELLPKDALQYLLAAIEVAMGHGEVLPSACAA